MAAAAKRIGRLKRVDRAAVALITLGGVAVVVAVLGILVFIAGQAVPLFTAARVVSQGEAQIATGIIPANASSHRAVGVDEYRKYIFTVEPSGTVVFFRLESGKKVREFPIPKLNRATVTASSRTVTGDYLAAALSDGRIALMQPHLVPEYEGDALKDLTLDVRDQGTIAADGTGRPARQVSYIEQDGQKFVASLVADDEVSYWWTDGEGKEHRASLKVDVPHRITQVRIGRNGSVLAGTDRGFVYHWALLPELKRTDVSPVSKSAITALEWMLGGNSWAAAAEDGTLSGWFRAPVGTEGDQAMVRAHTFAPQGAPIVALALSARERSFATIGRDGSIVLRHQTSERILTELPASGLVDAVLITPKADALVTLGSGRVQRFQVINPHPETSFKTLFRRVWYEGYPEPAYVWQSTGATDDFESKFSLVPLIFGTIKGSGIL